MATALLGALTGSWLRTRRSPGRLWFGLVGAGLACLALGWLWSMVFPLNKNLWTSSFVLWTAGLSLLLLSVFYGAIDVLGWRRWAFPFVVIGTNAITIYLLNRFIDFEGLAVLVLAEERMHPVLVLCAAMGLRWIVLYLLYRRRIFLRV